MVLRHSLAFLYLWCKSHIDLLNNLLGAIICEVCIDIERDLCPFMPSKILDGFDIYAPEQQIRDVCVAEDMRGHLKVNRVHDIRIMACSLTFDGLKGEGEFLAVYISVIGSCSHSTFLDVLP